MMYIIKKWKRILVLFSIVQMFVFSLRPEEYNLNTLSISSIERYKSEYLKKNRNIKFLKIGALLSGAIIASIVLKKMLFEGFVQEDRVIPDSSKLATEKTTSDEDLKNRLLDRILKKEEEFENKSKFQKFLSYFYDSILLGSAVSLSGAVFVVFKKELAKGLKVTKNLFSIRDNTLFYGEQIFNNGDNLGLFVENLIEPMGTLSDREFHKKQIVECHNILISSIEHFLAVLASTAHIKNKTIQENWLTNSHNKIFVAVEKLNIAVEKKLKQNENGSEFTDLKEIGLELKRLLNSIKSVWDNCEISFA